ncbi:GNAT family N-acetyltransferase [Xenorhabdus griffiniae]|uniref:GNAT family N-acetyltransferase n=1 Tax=Xenorhabdus griffiniae TaxID=351672 RepID=UPI002358AC1A|nr:GNAT family N-acetyltransferase [Xenorhabdus griffiniae]MDC9606249.1 hypothetical protein [Xenorhabdus griffiniae]
MPNSEEHNAISAASHYPTSLIAEKFYPEYQAKIKEVNKHDMLSELDALQENESRWFYRPIMGVFNNRHITFISTCNSIRNTFDSRYVTGGIHGYRHFICSCSVTGKVVGIIILNPARPNVSDNEVDQIAFIVTYPNGYGYGGLLIQHVVNISLGLGHKGILEVRAEPDAEIFYQKLGFEYMNNSNFLGLKQMKLNPDASDKWRKINGKYQIKRTPRPHSTNWQCHLL